MKIGLNTIAKFVKIANSVSNPRQGLNMMLEEASKRNPELANTIKQAINAGKRPEEFLKEQVQSGRVTIENFNDVKSAYRTAQKLGFAHKIDNKVWDELEQAIQGDFSTFRGF